MVRFSFAIVFYFCNLIVAFEHGLCVQESPRAVSKVDLAARGDQLSGGGLKVRSEVRRRGSL